MTIWRVVMKGVTLSPPPLRLGFDFVVPFPPPIYFFILPPPGRVALLHRTEAPLPGYQDQNTVRSTEGQYDWDQGHWPLRCGRFKQKHAIERSLGAGRGGWYQ